MFKDVPKGGDCILCRSLFFLIKTPDAARVYEALVRQGIIVRNRNSMTGCHGCLRITIGTPEENNRLINTLKSITHEI